MSEQVHTSLIAAILAVPWTWIAFRLWVAPISPGGTSPVLRLCIYALAAALTCIAVLGAVTR